MGILPQIELACCVVRAAPIARDRHLRQIRSPQPRTADRRLRRDFPGWSGYDSCIFIQYFMGGTMALPLLDVEAIHPDLWRASQLASALSRTVASGHAALDTELPGHGWPTGALTEVIVPQPGCGELRLLKPALEAIASRSVFVLQPPHKLQPAALT